jgi:glutaredoxin
MKLTKTLASEYPELVQQWHPTKNGDLTPFRVAPQSNKKVWWLCSKGHEWKTIANNRTVRRHGCPYCSNHRANKENCLAAANPELIREWHLTKNGKLTPNDVTCGSSKKIWWMCHKGHEWQATVVNRSRSKGSKCPYCTGLYATSENNLAVLYPELIKEIHPTKNDNFDPAKVNPHTPKKIWWKCNNEHEWFAQIASRTGKNRCGCPHCHKQYSILELRIYAELSYYFKNVIWQDESQGVEIDVFMPNEKIGIEADGSFWHKDKYEKDKAKSDFLMSKGINLIRLRALPLRKTTDLDISYSEKLSQFNIMKLVFFNLFYLLHDDKLLEYQNATEFKNQKLYIEMLERLKFPQKSIIDVAPELKNEWHPKNHLGPEKYSYGCGDRVWWICKNKHEWEASIDNRTIHGIGCPYCSNQRANKENCLATTNPELAKQWHLTKNGNLTSNDVTSGSGKKVWWKCKNGHEWESVIQLRNIGRGCPYCSNHAASQENCLATKNPELIKEWHPTKNGSLKPVDVTRGSSKKVWWICSKGHEWEAAIFTRAKGVNCPYCYKTNRKGIQLTIQCREKGK